MELIFTIKTQKSNSNSLSGKAYPLQQGKSHQTFVIDGAALLTKICSTRVNWYCNCKVYQNIRKLVC
jgi:hypothetical protein